MTHNPTSLVYTSSCKPDETLSCFFGLSVPAGSTHPERIRRLGQQYLFAPRAVP